MARSIHIIWGETPGAGSPGPTKPPLSVRLGISWLTNALVLGLVAALVSHVTVSGAGALLFAALVFGILNTIVKPVLRLATLPLAIITLGVAWFFVSLLMLEVTQGVVSGFQISGFWTFVQATVIVWLAGIALDFLPGPWQLTGRRWRRRVTTAATRQS